MIEKPLQQIALDFVQSRLEKDFTVLYNRLKPGLAKFIQRYHQDSETIDEILAITLSKAYIYVDTYDSQWNFSTWIYKICQNECLMELRRLKTISSLNTMMDSKVAIKAVNDDDWKTSPEYEVFSNEEVIQSDDLYADILEEIRNLPTHYKEIIEDKIVHKLKYQEIAEKRDIKINTVRTRIHSAKKIIKNLWLEKMKKSNIKTINIVGVTILQLLGDDTPDHIDHGEIKTLEIIKANYGAGNIWVDVTEKVKKSFIEKNEVKSSNRLGGDPCYGSPKALKIEYVCNEELFKVEIKEGKIFKI